MIRGRYFDTQDSTSYEAELEASADGRWRLRVNSTEQVLDPSQLQISDRIGNIPRKMRLPAGGEFETGDNEAVDALMGALKQPSGWVHALERRWGIAIAALAGIVVFTVLFIRVGLPMIAHWVADTLPIEADKLIGAQTLQILDKGIFDKSTLDPQRQASIQSLFSRMTASIDDGHDYRLALRHSSELGANAFALPAGIVVMTDELIELADNDEQLAAVLAHEVGHVRGRHALRQMIQGAGVSALALVVLGDLSSITALASVAPVLVQAQQSRDFEREADTFARQWLGDQGIDEKRFDEILCRITAEVKGERAFNFLSTHPATKERVKCVPQSV
jgi:predicted Zn-dependent protease